MRILKKLIVPLFMFLITLSCEKESFEHQTIDVAYESICSDLTPLVIGSYTGTLYKMGNFGFTPQVGFTYDTISSEQITISISRVFPEYNQIIDSLYCFYQMDTLYTGIFYMNDFSGSPTFIDTSYAGYHIFNFQEGKLEYTHNECFINCNGEDGSNGLEAPVETFVGFK